MEGSFICQKATYLAAAGANPARWGGWSDVTPVKNCKTSTAVDDCGAASVSSPAVVG